MNNKKVNIYKESQILVVVLIVMSIVGIIVFALTSRVLKGMKESTERRLANTSYSEAMGALDKTYNLFQSVEDDSPIDGCDYLSPDKISCRIASSQEGCDPSTVDIAYQNNIQKSFVKKDDVLEVNVTGYTGSAININVESGTNATLLVKTIGITGGSSQSYTVLNEALLSGWGSNNSQGFQISTYPSSIPKVIRIRPLYSDVTITVTGGSVSLPRQQRSYTTTTTCGVGSASAVTTKLVRVEWLYPGVSAPFDFVLYSDEGTLKKY